METSNSNKESNNFKIIQEKNYAILKSFSKNLIIITSHYSNPPKNMEIIYDGGKHAILYRDQTNIKILDFINEQVRKELLNAPHVTIIEVDKDKKIKYEYKTPINSFNKINIDQSKIATINDISEDKQKEMFEQLNSNSPDLEKINQIFSTT